MQLNHQADATPAEPSSDLNYNTCNHAAYQSDVPPSATTGATDHASTESAVPSGDQIVPLILAPASSDRSAKSVSFTQLSYGAQSEGQPEKQPEHVAAEVCRSSLPHKCRLKAESKLVLSSRSQSPELQHSDTAMQPTSAVAPRSLATPPQLFLPPIPDVISAPLDMSVPVLHTAAYIADQQRDLYQQQHHYHQQQQQQHPCQPHPWQLTPPGLISHFPAVSREDNLVDGLVTRPSPAAPDALGQAEGSALLPFTLSIHSIYSPLADTIKATSSTESAADHIRISNPCHSAALPQQQPTSATSSVGMIDAANLPAPPEVPKPGTGNKLSRVPRSTAKGWTAFTSFGLYARESVRALNSGAAPAHIEKLVGMMWSRLSAEDKQGWVVHARCGRGGASQGGKTVCKRPVKRPTDTSADASSSGVSGVVQQASGHDIVHKFTHHSLRSPRIQKANAVQLALSEDGNTELPVKWQRKVARIEQRPGPHKGPVKLGDLQLEVNTIETLAGMQAAAFAGSHT